jgi:arginase
MLSHYLIHLFGYASSIAGPGPGCGNGPLALEKSHIFNEKLAEAGVQVQWERTTQPIAADTSPLQSVTRQCNLIAQDISRCVKEKQFFMVMGGDHSSAIGTWSGACHALQPNGKLGLIWIDAHMDSHTPETSLTGNFHGMPLACLLGQGTPSLIHLLTDMPKLDPAHLCLIGIRSFEPEEKVLLDRLNVRIIYMDEVKQRGLSSVMDEAIAIASTGTLGYGLSIDIDSIDPDDAPGTDVVEPDGLSGEELCKALKVFAQDSRLIGAEIVEFDPDRDKEQKTEKLITRMTEAILLGK